MMATDDWTAATWLLLLSDSRLDLHVLHTAWQPRLWYLFWLLWGRPNSKNELYMCWTCTTTVYNSYMCCVVSMMMSVASSIHGLARGVKRAFSPFTILPAAHCASLCSHVWVGTSTLPLPSLFPLFSSSLPSLSTLFFYSLFSTLFSLHTHANYNADSDCRRRSQGYLINENAGITTASSFFFQKKICILTIRNVPR